MPLIAIIDSLKTSHTCSVTTNVFFAFPAGVDLQQTSKPPRTTLSNVD